MQKVVVVEVRFPQISSPTVSLYAKEKTKIKTHTFHN